MGAVNNPTPGGIKSIQRGTISLNNTSGGGAQTATITSVNTAKSLVRLLGFTSADTNTPSTSVIYVGANFLKLVLTNATTLTASSAQQFAAGTVLVLSYEVEEWY